MYCTEMVSKVVVVSMYIFWVLLRVYHRCTNHWNDLDSGQGGQRSHVHTRALMDVFSRNELWKRWGIVDGILVSVVFDFDWNTLLIYDIQPFTAYFPWADIHELIAPDILHQIIKGTFKDLIVKWVGDYLVHEHGEVQAQVIWADIDRRWHPIFINKPNLLANWWIQNCCSPIISRVASISSETRIQTMDR